MKKLVQAIVTFSLRNTTFILLATLALLFAGVYALKHTPIEAFPDVTNTKGRVIVQWPGRSAEEVEKMITLPLSKALNNIPHKVNLRSISLFGLPAYAQLRRRGTSRFLCTWSRRILCPWRLFRFLGNGRLLHPRFLGG